MKKFTCPCFVRIENTKRQKELINWMFSIGYHGVAGGIEDDSTVCNTVSMIERYDCGTNISLFKALAAMNDTDDIAQWFIVTCLYDDGTKEDRMFRCTDAPFSPYKEHIGCGVLDFRKATKEEIINHFKK